MIPPLNDDGFLPPGRWGATLDEVRDRFATGPTPRRAEVWAEFEQALALLRSAVRVSRVWLGGSFLTSKAEPGDVDAVFLIRADRLEQAEQDYDDGTVVWLAASGPMFKKVTGLRVDSFIVPWALEDTDEMTVLQYQRMRGYWDDWWERRRSAPGEPLESEAHQRRGYVEVVIDGNR